MARRRPRYPGSHPRSFGERYKEHAPEEFPEHTAHLRSKGRTPASTHVPVMVGEVLEHLDPRPGEKFVDCTLGYGGHASAILERIGPDGLLIGLDVDGVELAKTVAHLAPRFGESLHAHRLRFAGIAKALEREGIEAVDGILADLGVSSMQLDDPSRGFSVKRDGPLDLRMDDRLKRTGADVVNTLEEDELAAALRDLADEPDAEAIAREIVARRRTRPFARTGELRDAILAAKRVARGDCARSFQAVRMLVNDELANVRELLRVAPLVLKPAGRFVVISFHSGEDRLVKDAFRSGYGTGVWSEIAEELLRPDADEVRANPRASPARLRWAVRADPSEREVA